MGFTDPGFAPFLLAVLTLAYAFRSRGRLVWLLVLSSIFFYGFGNPGQLLILGAVALLDFRVGLALGTVSNPLHRRLLLALSICSNVGILAFFKYSNYFLGLTNKAGWTHQPFLELAIPLGISFFTFESLSYSIDVYRRTITPEKSLPRFLAFLSFFPHLVAGPIVRGRDFLPQLEGNFIARADASGVFHILFGLFKKLILSDYLASAASVDLAFYSPQSFSSADLAIAAISYTFQIFLDFSAYSDIAIGVSKLLGIELAANFDAPYLSRSIAEFWRRWHISLSSWFRDYVYLPLGGGRVSQVRWAANVLIVFLLSGFWHGAATKFLVWGGLHGTLIIGERILGKLMVRLGWGAFVESRAVGLVRTVLVFAALVMTFIVFRSQTVSQALLYLQILAKFDMKPTLLGPGLALALLVTVLLHVYVERARYQLAEAFCRFPIYVQSGAAWIVLLMIYESGLRRLNHGNFIYFQF